MKLSEWRRWLKELDKVVTIAIRSFCTKESYMFLCYSVSLSFSPDLSMPVKILFEPSKISSIESNLDNPFHLEARFYLSSITIHSRISYVSKRHLCGRRESMVSKDVKRKKKSSWEQNGPEWLLPRMPDLVRVFTWLSSSDLLFVSFQWKRMTKDDL